MLVGLSNKPIINALYVVSKVCKLHCLPQSGSYILLNVEVHAVPSANFRHSSTFFRVKLELVLFFFSWHTHYNRYVKL